MQSFTGIYDNNQLVQKTKMNVNGTDVTFTNGTELEGIYEGTSVREWEQGNRKNTEKIYGTFDINGFPHGRCKIVVNGAQFKQIEADMCNGIIVRKYSEKLISN